MYWKSSIISLNLHKYQTVRLTVETSAQPLTCTGLSVGFSVGGSIQKVGGYFLFISPISRSAYFDNPDVAHL